MQARKEAEEKSEEEKQNLEELQRIAVRCHTKTFHCKINVDSILLGS